MATANPANQRRHALHTLCTQLGYIGQVGQGGRARQIHKANAGGGAWWQEGAGDTSGVVHGGLSCGCQSQGQAPASAGEEGGTHVCSEESACAYGCGLRCACGGDERAEDGRVRGDAVEGAVVVEKSRGFGDRTPQRVLAVPTVTVLLFSLRGRVCSMFA